MKILVTGSEGNIGSKLVPHLIRAGHGVIGLDKKSLDYGHYHLDAVIHLAADHEVNASWDSVLKNNIIGTANVYAQALLHGVKKIILASSNHVTGCYEGTPPRLHLEDKPRIITIDDVVRPDGNYGTSKVFGEAVARQFYENYGMTSYCLRIGSFLEDDNPIKSDKRFLKTWISHRDFFSLIDRCLETRMNEPRFGVYYAVSNNKSKFWDTSNAERELDWVPQDDASIL